MPWRQQAPSCNLGPQRCLATQAVLRPAGTGRRAVYRKQRRTLTAARSIDGGNLDSPGLVDAQKYHVGQEDRTYQVLSADYGFRAGSDRNTEREGEIPANLFMLGWENFRREYRSLRKSFRYDEYGSIYKKTTRSPLVQVLALPGTAFIKLMAFADVQLQRIGVLSVLDPDQTPDELHQGSQQMAAQARDIRKRLGELELDIDAIWARERNREQDPDWAIHRAPWFVKGIYYALCSLLDAIYRDRPIERFWLNETVARMPYFGYISMLHMYESLGWWRAGTELRKLHYAEEANELNHLMIMEALGGDRLWVDRFFAQHCAVFYYWAIILLFVFSPSLAYVFSELVEAHAVDTYSQFLDQNEAALKQLPPPAVALEYYKAKDMYLFDALHKDGGLVNPRRPSCNNLYEVFRNIREDEQEHVDVMTACRDSTIADALADRKKVDGAQGSFVGPHATMDEGQLA